MRAIEKEVGVGMLQLWHLPAMATLCVRWEGESFLFLSTALNDSGEHLGCVFIMCILSGRLLKKIYFLNYYL